jgi:uncharacterized protein
MMTASPLKDTELDRLGDALGRFRSPTAMNLEQLDGFFTALICCPDMVMPSEYLHEIWGGEMADEEAFADQQALQNFLDLVMRHWNSITQTLQSGGAFLPVLLQDEHGVAHANDWAKGFMRGVALRNETPLELVNDEERGGALVPILALAHEHDPDPEMRPYLRTGGRRPAGATDRWGCCRCAGDLPRFRAASTPGGPSRQASRHLPTNHAKARAQ